MKGTWIAAWALAYWGSGLGVARGDTPPEGPGTPALESVRPSEEVVDRIVATIGKEAITQFQVEARVREMNNPLARFIAQPAPDDEKTFQAALDDLIAERLLMREARRLQIEVSDDEVEQSLRAMRQENGWSEEDYDAVLQMLGFDRKTYFQTRKEQMVRGKVLQYKVYSRIRVTDREVEEAFLKEYHQGQGEDQVHLWHIVFRIPTEVTLEQLESLVARAQEVRELVVSGQMSFEDAARRFSEDGSSQSGGDVGFFGRGQLLPALEELAFRLEIGEVSPVVQSPIGFHILRVTERRVVPIRDPKEARARVRYRLTEEAFQKEYRAFIASLRAEARVQVRWPHTPRE